MPISENIINAFLAGRQLANQRVQQQQEREDRQLQQESMALQLKHLKLQDKLQARELAKQNVDLLQGQPFGQISQPVQEGESGGYDLASFQPGQGIPQQRVIRPVTIPGVEELGVGSVDVIPQSMEQQIQARLAAKRLDALNTPQKVGKDEIVTLGGQTIAEGPKSDPTQSMPLDRAYDAAVQRGDQASAKRILASIKATKMADDDPTLKQLRELQAAVLGQQIKAGGMTPSQASYAKSLADDFTVQSRDYIARAQAYQSINAAAADPSAAGDLALIFSYMRMLDPGSTVREGEFANAQNAAGIPDRIKNLYNRAVNGERLNDNQRTDFVGQAKTQFAQAQRRQQGIMKVYTGRAQKANLDPAQVVMDFDQVYGVNEPPAVPAQSTQGSTYKAGQSVTLKNGRTVTIKKINSDGTFEY